jgi:hypothetical protein
MPPCILKTHVPFLLHACLHIGFVVCDCDKNVQ